MIDSILLVSSADKGTQAMITLLKSNGYPHVHLARSGTEARRLSAVHDYGLIIINAPLSDEFGAELAGTLATEILCSVLLIVKNEMVDEVFARLEDTGALVLGKPLNRTFFYQMLRLADVSSRRVAGLQNQNEKLQRRIEEIRLIDRAKCLLIEHEQLSEAEAHRKLEKDAMDRRRTRRQIAEEIIRRYDI